MAEPPHPWTSLLRAGDYAGFATALAAAGHATVPVERLASAARDAHRRATGERLPPGPTADLTVLHRLVAAGLLARGALADFGG